MIRKDFDSDEEWEFWNWLIEAREYGLVSELEYQPETYVLSDKIEYPQVVHLKTKDKIIYKTLLGGCTYTPDFQFKIHNRAIQEHIKKLHTVRYDKTIVDTKGIFAGKNNTSAATFPVKAKWLFQKYGLYVEKVIPINIFKETWVPEEARLSSVRRQPVKKYIGCLTIKDFIET